MIHSGPTLTDDSQQRPYSIIMIMWLKIFAAVLLCKHLLFPLAKGRLSYVTTISR